MLIVQFYCTCMHANRTFPVLLILCDNHRCAFKHIHVHLVAAILVKILAIGVFYSAVQSVSL